MTIQEITGKLSEYFLKNDAFTLSVDANKKNKNDDFKQIVLISEQPEKDRAAVRLALEEMEKAGFVASVKDDSNFYWILKKPLTSYSQAVVLSPSTIHKLSGVINALCEASNDKDNFCNPLNITDGDVDTACSVLLNLLKERGEKKD